MTTAARINKGATLSMGTAAIALTAIGEILDIKEPGFTRELIDVTTHDSGDAVEYIAEGVYDTTEISVTLHYVAGSAADLALLAATQAVGETALRYFSLTPKAAVGTKLRTFAGFVTAYEPDSKPVRGKQTATVTIKATGAITQAA